MTNEPMTVQDDPPTYWREHPLPNGGAVLIGPTTLGVWVHFRRPDGIATRIRLTREAFEALVTLGEAERAAYCLAG
jgi:hypothetical protein